MAKTPAAKKTPRPARAAAPVAAAAPAGDSTAAADAAIDAADSTATAADTAAQGNDAADTTAEVDAIDDAGSGTAAADAVQQLADDQTGEATERLAEQGQRPTVVLPAGQAVYRVLSALNHDLRDYPAGSDITLTVDQAAPLLGHTVASQNAPEADA